MCVYVHKRDETSKICAEHSLFCVGVRINGKVDEWLPTIYSFLKSYNAF